jgi:hypothetical protein
MWSLLTGTLAAAALILAAPTTGPAHRSIASLKANPAAVAGGTFEVDGEVVDVRSVSPIGHRGLYRLVDASDTAGVLVQTDDLPTNGGAFRVSARLAPGQPQGSLLLLVEIHRNPTDGRPLIPVAALILSVLAVVLLGVLSGQAIHEQRQYLLALPLWLLPYAAPTGKTDKSSSDALPALRFEPELESEDRRHHVRLRNRKRALLTGVGAAAALTGLSALWVASTRPPASILPTFVLLADNAAQRSVPVPDASATRTDSVGDQPSTVRILPPGIPRSTAAVVKQPIARDTVRVRPPTPVAPPPVRVARTVPKVSPPAVLQSSGAGVAAVPTPTVTNPLPPPPPQPAPVPPPVPSPATASPTRSPESDLVEATAAVRDGAAGLVAAINAKQDAELAQLLPAGQAGDRSRLTRFLKLIKDYGPRATLGTVAEPALAGDRGEAKFSLSLSWRGDFGVSSRKTGAFLGALRHTDGGWRFDGARLLDNLP